ncbi:MAG TPA: AbrB/MazE/SpoVT family DNA-binding domain-containing protein [Gemmataceae bacterium]|nr:AbrB/MazE/SpoVT family DNA-binding domain-containing protein [Gemmataceae bacterium]
MTTILKADPSGAVTLPAELCRAAGLAPGAELVAEVEAGRIVLGPARPPIWERVVALTADAPPEELAKPPTDSASQHDHYLYGSPKKPEFRLEVSYHETTGEPVAAYLRVREGKVAETKEVSEGVAFADYAADGLLLGVELLAPCRVEVLDRLSAKEPEPVRRFLRRGVRTEMICA